MEDDLRLKAGLGEIPQLVLNCAGRPVHHDPIVDVDPHWCRDPQRVPHGLVGESNFTSNGAIAGFFSQTPNLGHDRIGIGQIEILVAS